MSFQKYELSVLDVISTLNSEQVGSLEGLFPDERKRLVDWLRWRIADKQWSTGAPDRRRIDNAIRELAQMLIDVEDKQRWHQETGRR